MKRERKRVFFFYCNSNESSFYIHYKFTWFLIFILFFVYEEKQKQIKASNIKCTLSKKKKLKKKTFFPYY